MKHNVTISLVIETNDYNGFQTDTDFENKLPCSPMGTSPNEVIDLVNDMLLGSADLPQRYSIAIGDNKVEFNYYSPCNRAFPVSSVPTPWSDEIDSSICVPDASP